MSSRPTAQTCHACQMLLQVLEEASVAEVIDVSAEKHQIWVDVIGHTVVGGHGVANNGWHHEGGGAVVNALPTAFYQGTKSGNEIKLSHFRNIQESQTCFSAAQTVSELWKADYNGALWKTSVASLQDHIIVQKQNDSFMQKKCAWKTKKKAPQYVKALSPLPTILCQC